MKRDRKRRAVAFAIAIGAKKVYTIILVSKLPLEEQRQYQNYLRMTEENLDEL